MMSVMHALASELFEGFAMPIPHEKCPLRVAKIAFPLLLMQCRFFWNPNAASQVCILPDPDIFAFDIMPSPSESA